MKLYRYRPLSELLFKELLYREIYLATPTELNDPLDLNGQLNFFSNNENDIKSLTNFLFKQAFVSYRQIETLKPLMGLMSYENLGSYIKGGFAKYNDGIVSKDSLFDILSKFYQEYVSSEKGLEELNVEVLLSCLDELFTQFLNNSSVACFSQNNTDFLMWSHYASGHTGICLEFELHAVPNKNDTLQIPLLSKVPIDGEFIEWMDKVDMVNYCHSISQLDFYNYLPVFDNTGDVDLMHLSKSYWHQYADGIKKVFLEKLSPWCEEREWRIVHIHFQKTMPEDRILNFNRSSLTGVYFGAKSSEETRIRIKNIFEAEKNLPTFYQCQVDGSRGIIIKKT